VEFQQLSSQRAFEGHVFSIELGVFQDPAGGNFDRDIVRHPGAVAVLALTEDSKAILVRQWRPAIGQWILEAPAGTLDIAGEEAAAAASRELREEVGVEADELRYLGSSFNSPGFCDQVTHLYLAQHLRAVERELTGAEEIFSTVVEMALDDLLASSETMDSTTRQLALLALRHLGR